jgi:hypothetical protein
LPTSPTTFLRLVRAAPTPHTPALQAIGVDEWAWRRGHCYGTILVDIMTHRVVDLLPDRSAATVAAWLAQHPTITVVCRDRSELYADGIRRGAPEAVQVVDRFHLVNNLRQALEGLLITRRAALQAAANGTAQALLPRGSPVLVTRMYQGRRQSATKGQLRAEAERERRNAPRVEAFHAVHTLHAQGTPIAAIARAHGISLPTVYAYLRRHTPPSPKRPLRRQSPQVPTPYLPYLIRRWRESGANIVQLWREIQALGYTHSAQTVCRFITRLRRAGEAGGTPELERSLYTRPWGPSGRAAITRGADLSGTALPGRYGQCASQCPDSGLSDHGPGALGRSPGGVDGRGDAQCHRCARALRPWAAGRPARHQSRATLEWSNGVTEAQIHHLKLLKRQGYRRAGFARLRQRVLQAA